MYANTFDASVYTNELVEQATRRGGATLEPSLHDPAELAQLLPQRKTLKGDRHGMPAAYEIRCQELSIPLTGEHQDFCVGWEHRDKPTLYVLSPIPPFGYLHLVECALIWRYHARWVQQAVLG
jgi:hypothetical protein